MGPAGILGESLRFYGRHALLLIAVAALALLPAHLVSAGLSAQLTGLSAGGFAPVSARPRPPETVLPEAQGSTPPPQRSDTAQVLGRDHTEPPPLLPITWRGPLTVGLLWLVSLVVGLLGAFLAGAAILHIVASGEGARGSRPGMAEAWAAVAARLGPLLRTSLLAVLLIGLGFACFVLPGLVLAVGLAFTAPVVMLEKLSGSAALRRSWELMRREWPAALGISLLYLGLTLLLQSGLASLMPESAPWARMAASGAVGLALRPLPIVAIAMLYLRSRGRQLVSI